MKTALYVATVARTYRKAIDDYNAGVFNYYYTNLNWVRQKLMEQPKYVMASYKNFVEKLKKI